MIYGTTEAINPELGSWVRTWVRFGLKKELLKIALACVPKSRVRSHIEAYVQGCENYGPNASYQVVAFNSVRNHPYVWLFDITHKSQHEYAKILENIPIRFKRRTKAGLMRDVIASFKDWKPSWDSCPFDVYPDLTLPLIKAQFERKGINNLDKAEVARYLAVYNPAMTDELWESTLSIYLTHTS